MLLLYDAPVSSNALKVRFLLEELGLPYERREIPIAKPRSDWYLALNPHGLIPAVSDDGQPIISESNTIIRFLANREGRDDLYPTDPHDRARVDEFLDAFSTRIRGQFYRHEALAMGHTREGGFGTRPPDREGADQMAVTIAPTLGSLDKWVTGGGAVLDRFTIADCALAPILYRTQHSGLSLDPYPNLTKLREALVSRPGFISAGPII